MRGEKRHIFWVGKLLKFPINQSTWHSTWPWGDRSHDEAGDTSGALRMLQGCVATVRSSDFVLRTNKSQWRSECQNWYKLFKFTLNAEKYIWLWSLPLWPYVLVSILAFCFCFSFWEDRDPFKILNRTGHSSLKRTATHRHIHNLANHFRAQSYPGWEFLV